MPVNSGPQERARVRSRIGSLIMEFCRENRTFHMKDLLWFVESRIEGKVAPGSPERILRLLRQQGALQYEVVSRRESFYRMVVDRPAEQVGLFAARAS